MIDVQQMAEGLEFDKPLPDFDALRREVENLVTAGEMEKVRLRLQDCRQFGDDTRSAQENSWLYEKLSHAYLARDDAEAAVAALERAFELDPHNLEVAQVLSELLMAQERFDDGLAVAKLLLLNHKKNLPDSEIAAIYRRIGLLQEGRGEFEEARSAFEKALVKESEDPQALTGLLRTVGKVGEPGDVVDVRLKLVRSLDNAQARSTALLALGNDWIDQFNNPGRALDTFEEAVSEWQGNVRAVERIAEVAAELGDWRRTCRAYFTLSVLVDEPARKADYLIRSSDVARQELWEPEKALAGYRKALEWDPTRLDAFKSVTAILVDARDWENLEQAYLQIITANQENPNADADLLAVLWEKLGDLYSDHLDRFDDAVFAYGQAVEHMPERRDLRLRLVELAEDREGQLDLAEEHLRVLMELSPQDSQWVDRLGRVYLRKKEIDHAYCMFRTLRVRGENLDAKAAGFLERFDSKIVRPIRGQINPSMMHRYIFAPGLDQTLNECFTLLTTALDDWTGESRRKYGLSRKDKVKLSDPLAFVNFYKSIGAALGYVDLPDLWRKPDQVGLVNGALIPQGLLVGDASLSSGREKHIAFLVAKQLFLFMPSFYLATIRPLGDLQGFFVRAVALTKPEMNLAESFAKDSAFKAMKKTLKGPELEKLRQCVDQLTAGKKEVVLGPWVEAIEDSANRMGLLFCDDLEVARDCLREEPRCISQRSTKDRMRSLIDYSVSEKYLSLRSQLGIQVA